MTDPAANEWMSIGEDDPLLEFAYVRPAPSACVAALDESSASRRKFLTHFHTRFTLTCPVAVRSVMGWHYMSHRRRCEKN